MNNPLTPTVDQNVEDLLSRVLSPVPGLNADSYRQLTKVIMAVVRSGLYQEAAEHLTGWATLARTEYRSTGTDLMVIQGVEHAARMLNQRATNLEADNE